jgi:ribosome biogenesis GTPase
MTQRQRYCLGQLGWTDSLTEAFRPMRGEGCRPGRVAATLRGHHILWHEEGEADAKSPSRLIHLKGGPEGTPVVGDWVAFKGARGGRAEIVAILPRQSRLSRKMPGRATVEQVIVANITTVFVVMSLAEEYSIQRLERYLVMVRAGGCHPVVVLNKADLWPAADVRDFRAQVREAAPGTEVLPVSALANKGIEKLRPWLGKGETVAVVGSSGVGKSTLVNRIVGHELMATREVRENDGRGRHTTTTRQMILLPAGGLLVDNPGMREIQPWIDADRADLADHFPDVVEIAARCRFSNCRHDTEPGCAIREALGSGTLSDERYRAFQKLGAELDEQRRLVRERGEGRRRR